MPETYSAADFAAVLADPSKPLIVGGQAVNIWAEIYVTSEPALAEFAPFTSHDADIHGDRALAALLQKRTGWTCRFFNEPRQIAVAVLTKQAAPGEPPLNVEVLRTVTGLSPADLNRHEIRELLQGQQYRIPSPFVLLKAKLANLALLSRENRPQDLKHTKMLLPISREYFREMHAAIGRQDMTERNFLAAVSYASSVIRAPAAVRTAAAVSLDLSSIFPSELGMSPHPKIRAFAGQQLPRFTPRARQSPSR